MGIAGPLWVMEPLRGGSWEAAAEVSLEVGCSGGGCEVVVLLGPGDALRGPVPGDFDRRPGEIDAALAAAARTKLRRGDLDLDRPREVLLGDLDRDLDLDSRLASLRSPSNTLLPGDRDLLLPLLVAVISLGRMMGLREE